MKKEFVPYQQALELRELGFDEPCLVGYSTSTEKLEFYSRPYITKDSFTIDAPTFSQAYRWFKEKHGQFLLSDYGKFPHITIIQNLMFQNPNITYEEAELDCLKILIVTIYNK